MTPDPVAEAIFFEARWCPPDGFSPQAWPVRAGSPIERREDLTRRRKRLARAGCSAETIEAHLPGTLAR